MGGMRTPVGHYLADVAQSRPEESSNESSEPQTASLSLPAKVPEFMAFLYEHPIELPQLRHL
jgi:hypothetical protein